MSTPHVTAHHLDGHAYLIDEHRMIREVGRFRDLPVYAPYFWNAYVDGSYDDEYWDNGLHVIVFNITDDDRFDYPELAGGTKVHIWEDPCGALQLRVDRQA